ncbi:MAG: hypothetical protein K2Y32_09085 [Candidatus Obscuribacterales bacterium]|nr:hypothetical protein [Candidatus Obscuribacterales bacterium]
MKKSRLAFGAVVAMTFLTSVATNQAFSEESKKNTGIGRLEGARDLNLFQVEPSIINEKFYTSGQAERHQYVGNVLPPGAPIPDNGPPGPQAKVEGKKSNSEKFQKTEDSAKDSSSVKPGTEISKATDAEISAERKELKDEKEAKDSKNSERKHKASGYYRSGRAERNQFIGNTLPYGAPIPDNE